MKLQGAIIKERGVSFAVVVVTKQSMATDHQAHLTRQSFHKYFHDLSIVLASQDAHGQFEYQGRPDLTVFLGSLHPSQIPWKEYTFS